MPKRPAQLSPVPEQEPDVEGRPPGSTSRAEASRAGSRGSATFSRSAGEPQDLCEEKDAYYPESESEDEEQQQREQDEKQEWDTDLEIEGTA